MAKGEITHKKIIFSQSRNNFHCVSGHKTKRNNTNISNGKCKTEISIRIWNNDTLWMPGHKWKEYATSLSMTSQVEVLGILWILMELHSFIQAEGVGIYFWFPWLGKIIILIMLIILSRYKNWMKIFLL